jgi:hypothetical protein
MLLPSPAMPLTVHVVEAAEVKRVFPPGTAVLALPERKLVVPLSTLSVEKTVLVDITGHDVCDE